MPVVKVLSTQTHYAKIVRKEYAYLVQFFKKAPDPENDEYLAELDYPTNNLTRATAVAEKDLRRCSPDADVVETVHT